MIVMDNQPSELHQQIPLFIGHDRQGDYFTLPFTMPADIELISLTYSY